MTDCRSTQALLQRAVAGLLVADEELDAALVHAAACDLCGPTSAADVQIEPTALFERALTTALSDPEAIVRRRAAERLGSFDRIGPAALAALVGAAAEDADEQVRSAALVALDELDDAVSLPQRLIESWSASPEQAAPFLADCIARLAAPGWRSSLRVTPLVASGPDAEGELSIEGEQGITGRLGQTREQVWLRLNRLPEAFEETLPVVAVPRALEPDAPPIEWSGESPGLVPAQAPVARGSLEVLLGNVAEAATHGPALSASNFERLYLLNPREHGTSF